MKKDEAIAAFLIKSRRLFSKIGLLGFFIELGFDS
jgi:hypothetical protein